MKVTISQSSSHPEVTVTIDAESIKILEMSGATLQVQKEKSANTTVLVAEKPEDFNVLVEHSEGEQTKRSRIKLLRFGIWQYNISPENEARVS